MKPKKTPVTSRTCFAKKKHHNADPLSSSIPSQSCIDEATIEFDGPPLSHLSEDVIGSLTSMENGIYRIVGGRFRECCLGILGAQDHMMNTASLPTDFPNFQVQIQKNRQSIRLKVYKSPGNAFVDGEPTRLRKGHIGAAIRDMVYHALHFSVASTPKGRSDLVEQMIQDAGLLEPTRTIINRQQRDMHRVVVQGGHTVGSKDYDYSKHLGEELGLRYFETITGGGPGTMRGILKGNRKGFHQQKIHPTRQIGLTSPEIIAAEPPNVYVTDLVILPDIEKRLEGFKRLGHLDIILPGGAGTAEEVLLNLGIKLHGKNADQILPLLITASRDSLDYVAALEAFLTSTLGDDIRDLYSVHIGSPEDAARWAEKQMGDVLAARDLNDDSHEWNRSLYIPEEMQSPFEPTIEHVEKLALRKDLPLSQLAAELRKLFKTIVFGSVTSLGRKYVERNGKFRVRGDREILDALDKLLQCFIRQKRMRTTEYEPCYELTAI